MPVFYYKYCMFMPVFYYKFSIFVPVFYYKYMINRNIISDLSDWSKRKKRKPLVLRGARQVGKTTLIDEFGQNFAIYLKLNLDEPEHIQLFETYQNMDALLTGI